MAEEKAAQKSGIVGWVRAALTTVFGLVSGACLVYFSGLINYVIKPNKPVANFQSSAEGLKVACHNRSSGGSDGWWDFGDGSALEPFVTGQDTVTHTYTRPGVYSIKLSLRNLFGEEHERSVNVTLGDAAVSGPPAIETFEVVPIRPDTYAPATFKIVSKVKNADLCVWVPSHEHPVQVITDLSGAQERYVTLKHPGVHLLKLAAYGNKQVIEQARAVRVERQQPGTLMAVLNITHQAVHITTKTLPQPLAITFPQGTRDTVFKFARAIAAPPGFQITAARFTQPVQGPNLKSPPTLQVTADKVTLTGELVKTANAPLTWVAPILLTLEQRTDVMPMPLGTVAYPLTVPGTTVLPMPALQGGWVSRQRSLTLSVHDEKEQSLWQCTQMPRTDELTLSGRRFRLSASEAGEKIRIDVVEVRPGAHPLGN